MRDSSLTADNALLLRDHLNAMEEIFGRVERLASDCLQCQ